MRGDLLGLGFGAFFPFFFFFFSLQNGETFEQADC